MTSKNSRATRPRATSTVRFAIEVHQDLFEQDLLGSKFHASARDRRVSVKGRHARSKPRRWSPDA